MNSLPNPQADNPDFLGVVSCALQIASSSPGPARVKGYQTGPESLLTEISRTKRGWRPVAQSVKHMRFQSGKPRALRLDAYKAGVISAYSGDSPERRAPFCVSLSAAAWKADTRRLSGDEADGNVDLDRGTQRLAKAGVATGPHSAKHMTTSTYLVNQIARPYGKSGGP